MYLVNDKNLTRIKSESNKLHVNFPLILHSVYQINRKNRSPLCGSMNITQAKKSKKKDKKGLLFYKVLFCYPQISPLVYFLLHMFLCFCFKRKLDFFFLPNKFENLYYLLFFNNNNINNSFYKNF